MPTRPAGNPIRIVLIAVATIGLVAWLVFRLPTILSSAGGGAGQTQQTPATPEDAGDLGVFDVRGGDEVAGLRLELLAIEHQQGSRLEAVALGVHNVSPAAAELWLGRDLNGRPNLSEVFELEVVDMEGNAAMLRLPESPHAGEFAEYRLPLSVGASHTLRFGAEGPAGGEHPLLPFKVRVCYSGMVRHLTEDGQRESREVEIWSNQLTVVRPWPLAREALYKDAAGDRGAAGSAHSAAGAGIDSRLPSQVTILH